MNKCEACNRGFNTEESLKQHMKDKHGIYAQPTKHEKRLHELKQREEEKKRLLENKIKRGRMKKFVIAGIFAALILSIAFIFSGSSGDYTPVTGLAAADIVDNGKNPFLGVENAPVEIVEYSDFECPFCTRFFFQTEPRIKEEYIGTGKVKFVYKDFPVVAAHPRAQLAAEAAQCAFDQGKFWEFHDKLFQNNYQGDNWIRTSQAKTLFKKYAADIGLDTAKFNSCLDSGAKRNSVLADLSEGQSKGVRGTPSFLVNGKLVVGAQPFSVFKQMIDAELAR